MNNLPPPCSGIEPETSSSKIEDNSESGIDSDSASNLQTVSSSIRQHRYENGRRYHKYKAGTYMFPNDEKENDRMDLMHHIWLIGAEGKLYQAPIGEHTKRILDVGCGTGLWAILIGDEMPHAKVIGTDLSPHQPTWIPQNVEFQIDDYEEEWTFKEKFDFIRIANLIGSTKDWPKLIRQCFAFLKPGGWLEVDETVMCPLCDDGTMKPDDKLENWTRKIEEMSLRHGRIMMNPWDWRDLLRDTGFTDVNQKVFNVPVGAWAKDKRLKEVGLIYQVFMEEGLEAVSFMLLLGLGGMSKEELDEMLEGVRKSLKQSRKIHRYYPFHYTWGQKPLEEPKPSV